MKNERLFRILFRLAAAYNITVGTYVVFFPQTFFRFLHLPDINYPYVMSGLGMFVAVYGYGFYLVSRDLHRNYAFALLGIAGKSFGVIGWWYYTVLGVIPLSSWWMNFCNDVAWIPFFIIYLRWHSRSIH